MDVRQTCGTTRTLRHLTYCDNLIGQTAVKYYVYYTQGIYLCAVASWPSSLSIIGGRIGTDTGTSKGTAVCAGRRRVEKYRTHRLWDSLYGNQIDSRMRQACECTIRRESIREENDELLLSSFKWKHVQQW